MKDTQQTEPHYLIVQGQRITVPEEVYIMIYEETNHFRYRIRCEKRCAQEDFSVCWGDCSTCRWQSRGIISSLNEMDVENSSVLASDYNLEEEAISNMTMQRIYEFADEAMPCFGGILLRLRFDEDCSNRQIANLLGVSHTVINRKLSVLLRLIRDNKELFF